MKAAMKLRVKDRRWSSLYLLLTGAFVLSALLVINNVSNGLVPQSALTGYLLASEREIIYPTIYSYLPHLRNDSDSLKPAFVYGPGKPYGVSIILGLPTVHRENQTYLISTLYNLLSCMNETERLDTLIVVYIGETDEQVVERMVRKIEHRFQTDIDQGLIVIIGPRTSYYPNLSEMAPSLNDTVERAQWRTKQNLDYAFLMMYAQPLGRYYVQLEDDIITVRGFISQMLEHASRQEALAPRWFVIEFSQLGFIGKLFRTVDLWYVISFAVMFHRDKPIDWLLEPFLDTRYCPPDRTVHCSHFRTAWNHFNISLFQHAGVVSSLNGKQQMAKDPKFRVTLSRKRHINPPADVSTSLQELGFKVKFAYEGVHFAWTLPPEAGDWILIRFRKPTHLAGYKIQSGTYENPSDLLYDTTVEVEPLRIPSERNVTGDGFLIVGDFDDLGLAEGRLDWKRLGPVQSLRLSIHSDSSHQVKISQVLLTEPTTT